MLVLAGMATNAAAVSVAWNWETDLCAGLPRGALTDQTLQI